MTDVEALQQSFMASMESMQKQFEAEKKQLEDQNAALEKENNKLKKQSVEFEQIFQEETKKNSNLTTFLQTSENFHKISIRI